MSKLASAKLIAVGLLIGLGVGFLVGKESREPNQYVIKTSQDDPTDEVVAKRRYTSNLAVLAANERDNGPNREQWDYNAQFTRFLLLWENERILKRFPHLG